MSDEMAGRLVIGGLAAAAAVLGLLGLRTGRAFRRGDNRHIARWYFDTSLQPGVRNMAFGQSAFGTAFLGAALAILGLFIPFSPLTALCVLVGGLVFTVAGVVGFMRLLRPPERMKPEWLKRREAGPRAG